MKAVPLGKASQDKNTFEKPWEARFEEVYTIRDVV
jgi:hypothetical protein